MNYKDITAKNDGELVALVVEQREVLRAVRFGTGGVGGGDVKKIREARQAIAWALTEASLRRKATAKRA